MGAVAAVGLILTHTGCTSPAPCDTAGFPPLLQLQVKGDAGKVAKVRACTADLSAEDCKANPVLTGTSTLAPQTGASQMPGTWKLTVIGRPSPVRITLLDAKQAVLLEKTVPLTWQSEAIDECHAQDHAELTLTIPTRS